MTSNSNEPINLDASELEKIKDDLQENSAVGDLASLEGQQIDTNVVVAKSESQNPDQTQTQLSNEHVLPQISDLSSVAMPVNNNNHNNNRQNSAGTDQNNINQLGQIQEHYNTNTMTLDLVNNINNHNINVNAHGITGYPGSQILPIDPLKNLDNNTNSIPFYNPTFGFHGDLSNMNHQNLLNHNTLASVFQDQSHHPQQQQ